MLTTDRTTHQDVEQSPAVAVRAARSGGSLFIAALVAFAAGFVTIVATLDPEYSAAEDAAAERLGVNLGDLPAAELARLNTEFGRFGSEVVVITVLLNLALILFALAVHTGLGATVRDGTGVRVLRAAASLLALATPVAWIVYFSMNAAVSSGAVPPASVLDLYDDHAITAMSVSGAAGAGALICLVVLLRRAGVARRTGVVVLALSTLAGLASLTVGVPPIVPCLLGALLGVALVRTRGPVGPTPVSH